MRRARLRVLHASAVAVGALAGIVVVVCTAVLISGHARALARAAELAPHFEELQERSPLDADAAALLNEEQVVEADATLEYRARRQRVVSVLIAAAVLLVACAKLAQVLAGWRPPPLKTLAELRREAEVSSPPASALRGEDWPTFEPAEIDAIIAREGTSREAAVPILNAVLARHGYLPDEALRRICERTEITPAQIAGNSTFYANFRSSAVGRHVLRVCHGTACHVAGSRRLEDELRRHVGIPEQADTDPERRFTVDRVACLGCCSLAPVVMVGEWTAGRLTPEVATRIVDELGEGRA